MKFESKGVTAISIVAFSSDADVSLLDALSKYFDRIVKHNPQIPACGHEPCSLDQGSVSSKVRGYGVAALCPLITKSRDMRR
jgi:hypothetical protein